MSDELGLMDGWIYGLLRNDAALVAILGQHPDSGECIYDALASRGAALPYVVFQVQATSPDIIAVGDMRIAANVTYAVRAVTAGGFSAASPIAARIDTLLHGARGAGVGGVVLSCHRQSPLKLPPEAAADGKVYYHQGGIYRVRARVR